MSICKEGSAGKQLLIDSERYMLIHKIGEGAQAQVFKVVHVPTNKQYALKIVTKPGIQEINEMVDEQLQIMKKLNFMNCPCITKLIAYQKTPLKNFLILELGEYSLKSMMQIFQRTLEDKQIMVLIQNILVALSDVHKIKIIHRDIKPQNIIVNNNNTMHPYKLTDFGVSTNKKSKLVTFIGTQNYMAPQVLKSKFQDNMYTQLADIWSFALVVFEAYFGFNPFLLSQKPRYEEQMHRINQLSQNGFNFNKLHEILNQINRPHLSHRLRKAYNSASKQIIQFLIKGLHMDPSKRIHLSGIQSLLNNWQSKQILKPKEHAKIPQSDINSQQTVLNVVKSDPFHTLKNPSPFHTLKNPSPFHTLKNPDPLHTLKIPKYPTNNQHNLSVRIKIPQIQSSAPVITHNNCIFKSSYQKSDFNVESKLQSIIESKDRSNCNVSAIEKRSSLKVSKQIQKVPNQDKSTPLIMKKFASTPERTVCQSKIMGLEQNHKIKQQWNTQKNKFFHKVQQKLKNLYSDIKILGSQSFQKLLVYVVSCLNDEKQAQCRTCIQSTLNLYHKLQHFYLQYPKFLLNRSWSQESVIQLLYWLLILSHLTFLSNNLDAVFQNTNSSKIHALQRNPVKLLNFKCNKQSLKQFEWRFLSKNLIKAP